MARDAHWDPSAPAPPGVEQIRGLLNTRDLYRGWDRLSDTTQARAALSDAGLLDVDDAIADADLVLLRETRESLREALVGSNDQAVGAATTLPVGVSFAIGANGDVVAAGQGLGVWVHLGEALIHLWAARRDGTLRRLKACANPGCQWVFYNLSRPNSGRWCSMKLCGAQHKSRAYRARNRTGDQ